MTSQVTPEMSLLQKGIAACQPGPLLSLLYFLVCPVSVPLDHERLRAGTCVAAPIPRGSPCVVNKAQVVGSREQEGTVLAVSWF